MIIDTGKYEILIENGSLKSAGEEIAKRIKPCRAVVVSDDNVHPLYAEILRGSLAGAGFDVAKDFIFPHGEESKNLTTFSAILEHLSEEKLTRTDLVVALGGGVTGDMAGFASAVYLRGIKYVGIPTSLLSMVDSSVGGKTAVDLSTGKNLVGAFHEPSFVLCDPTTLSTLPSEYYSDGMAEVIKTGLLGNSDLFSMLSGDISDKIEKIISMCVSDKRDIVSRDPFDHGERQKLNLGHTFGHAIEVLSDYTIHHGHAVASGMHMITKAAIKRGLCRKDVLPILDKLLVKYGLDPFLYNKFSDIDIFDAALHDKKMRGNNITLVIPREIGKSDLIGYPKDVILEMIREGVAE
ncbi:MAG: 3-dehydroquinate synthase [Ruminococcaceae bacterium]|nr:3-dehydroquinate synthase [Oscillospiraceae bacterium]